MTHISEDAGYNGLDQGPHFQQIAPSVLSQTARDFKPPCCTWLGNQHVCWNCLCWHDQRSAGWHGGIQYHHASVTCNLVRQNTILTRPWGVSLPDLQHLAGFIDHTVVHILQEAKCFQILYTSTPASGLFLMTYAEYRSLSASLEKRICWNI